MSGRLRTAPLALLLALGCSVAHLPPEPPKEVVDLARDLPVVLSSEPSGLRAFAEDPAGGPGPELGRTPLTLVTLTVRKQVWKHGEQAPPALEAQPSPPPALGREVLPGGRAEVTESGGPLRFPVYLERRAGEAPRRFVVEVPPAQLEQAFTRGRIEIGVSMR